MSCHLPIPITERRSTRLILGLWSLFVCVSVSGCGGPVAAEASAPDAFASFTRSIVPAEPVGPLRVVVTTGMVGDLVTKVAGDAARVTVLMGPGIDPHLYKPTRSDVKKILEADVVFYSGLHLEGRMDMLLHRASTPERPCVAVTQLLPHDQLLLPDPDSHLADPHAWMDVRLWSECLTPVVETLVALRPDRADTFRANAAHYRLELEELDRFLRRAIATIPESSRHLVTAHDAFGYYSRAYGIPVLSVQGVTTESEPGIQDINNLVRFLITNRVPAIFVETSVNSKGIDAVVEGAAARGWKVTPSGPLYSDALGPAGGAAGTYAGMIRTNTVTITEALGGNVSLPAASEKESP